MARKIHQLASGTPVGAAPGAFFMTRKFSEQRDIIKIAILAIGGQGGGVLADWIVHLAEANGYYAQTTSVPGVAQRTGATIYYLELVPETGRTPVLSLMPAPGDVDIVVGDNRLLDQRQRQQRSQRVLPFAGAFPDRGDH